MTSRRRLAAALVVLVVACGLAEWGRRTAERRLPAALEGAAGRQWGVRAEVGPIRLRLFPAAATIGGITAGRPAGLAADPLFTARSVRVSARLRGLLLGRLSLGSVVVDDATLRLVRAADGRLRPTAVDAAGEGEGEPPAEAQAGAAGIEEPAASLPAGMPFVVSSGRGDLRIMYTDLALADQPVEARFALQLAVSGIGTVGDADDPGDWGRVAATGTASCLDVSTPVAAVLALPPLTGEGLSDFDLEADIGAVGRAVTDLLLAKTSVRGELVSAHASLVCRGGRFDDAQSRLVLRLREVTLSDRAARKLGGAPVLPELTLPIPVAGTPDKPKLRVEQALAVAVLGGALGGSGAEGTGGIIGDAVKGLGRLFGGH